MTVIDIGPLRLHDRAAREVLARGAAALVPRGGSGPCMPLLL
jgi:hypothetical protein